MALFLSGLKIAKEVEHTLHSEIEEKRWPKSGCSFSQSTMSHSPSDAHDNDTKLENGGKVNESSTYYATKVAEEEPDRVIVSRFGRFGGFMEKLFASGVEARGVERVPEDQRDAKNVWNK